MVIPVHEQPWFVCDSKTWHDCRACQYWERLVRLKRHVSARGWL